MVGLLAALAFAAVQAALADSAVGIANVSLSADDDPADDDPADGEREGQERGDQGQGPPPWANNDHDKQKAHGKATGGNDAWKQLSPAARADLMTTLVKEHKRGMRTFATCQEAGSSPCEKPLPPGLAKKL